MFACKSHMPVSEAVGGWQERTISEVVKRCSEKVLNCIATRHHMSEHGYTAAANLPSARFFWLYSMSLHWAGHSIFTPINAWILKQFHSQQTLGKKCLQMCLLVIASMTGITWKLEVALTILGMSVGSCVLVSLLSTFTCKTDTHPKVTAYWFDVSTVSFH